ncbi:MAG: N-acetyltransferase [Candidatus Aminicenantes bacterium]|nr:MAG: N-acetyltransferase [Candidatus Aminicenantes bacterium]
MITVRVERNEDIGAIHLVNRMAFGQEDEAVLVQRIRESSGFIPALSLVAVKDSRVVGHILFSQIHIVTPKEDVAVLSLAPMAVLPEFQNLGIGSQLVNTGLEKCRESGHTIVVVIGHPQYYPRFGFVPAGKKGLDLLFSVPAEAFMVCELLPNALDGIEGTVIYPPEFAEAM